MNFVTENVINSVVFILLVFVRGCYSVFRFFNSNVWNALYLFEEAYLLRMHLLCIYLCRQNAFLSDKIGISVSMRTSQSFHLLNKWRCKYLFSLNEIYWSVLFFHCFAIRSLSESHSPPFFFINNIVSFIIIL